MEPQPTNDKKEKEIAESYLSSLIDLNVNSKPLINMLTMLAEENIEHGQAIVDVVEQRIAKVLIYFYLYIFFHLSLYDGQHETKTIIKNQYRTTAYSLHIT